MNAGHELDALVAEKVMGWTRADTLLRPPGGVARDGVTPAYYTVAPPYSTDIAAAWEVVEKLSPSQPFELTDVGSFNPGYDFSTDRWQASFGNDNVHTACAATAAHAICLAALKAVGAEIPT